MAKTSLADQDIVAANNTDVDSNGIAGSDNVSGGDNVIRAQAALLARFYDSLGGSATTTGTTTVALTITEDWSAYAHGMVVAAKMLNAASGASTLNITPKSTVALGAKAIRRQGDTAIQANDWLAGSTCLFKYDSAYNSAAGAWVLLNQDARGLTLIGNINCGFATSVNASALTIALKGADGNDPSSTNPVYLEMRTGSGGAGLPSFLTVTSALSLVISSGSTMGFSNATPGRLWFVVFNDSGTPRLGAVNCLTSTSVPEILGLATDLLRSSSAEGGAGGADSGAVVYTGTAVTNMPYAIIGYAEWAGLTAAGTWDTDADTKVVWVPGISLPGQVIKVRVSQDGAVATGSTPLPVDNTTPQNTEGNQFALKSHSPQSRCNVLEIEHTGHYASSNTDTQIAAALFQDTTAGALKSAAAARPATAGVMVQISLRHVMLALTTSSTSFKIRAGTNSAGTTTANGSAGSGLFNGTLASILSIKEYQG